MRDTEDFLYILMGLLLLLLLFTLGFILVGGALVFWRDYVL